MLCTDLLLQLYSMSATLQALTRLLHRRLLVGVSGEAEQDSTRPLSLENSGIDRLTLGASVAGVEFVCMRSALSLEEVTELATASHVPTAISHWVTQWTGNK